MSLILRRAPAASILSNVHRLNSWMDDAFNAWPFNDQPAAASGAQSWVPATDVSEGSNGIRITVELPGLKAEDVKLTLEHNTLTISGEKKAAAEEKSERVYRYERSYGAFERVFRLPDSIDSERVSAGFENGVLTVTLPKAERAKSREIAVEVK
jgi:HSP20 family protein